MVSFCPLLISKLLGLVHYVFQNFAYRPLSIVRYKTKWVYFSKPIGVSPKLHDIPQTLPVLCRVSRYLFRHVPWGSGPLLNLHYWPIGYTELTTSMSTKLRSATPCSRRVHTLRALRRGSYSSYNQSVKSRSPLCNNSRSLPRPDKRTLICNTSCSKTSSRITFLVCFQG